MIRQARPEDAPALRALLAENGQLLDGVAYETFSPPCLVYVLAGDVVGMAQALVGRPYAVVTELAIARDMQRRGYAVRLMEAMELLLREYGCTAWAAYSGEKNDAVNDCLERYGARPTGYGRGWIRSL